MNYQANRDYDNRGFSGLATQHSTEAKLCTETETKLESLQDWVSEQEKIN